MSTSTASRTVSYKGRTYRCLYIGDTKYGRRAHLQFFDGSKDFWVDASLVAVAESSTLPRRSNGYAPGKRCYCAECGEPYRKGQHCWENGGTCVPEWE